MKLKMINWQEKLSAQKIIFSRLLVEYLPKLILCFLTGLFVLIYTATIFNHHNRFWFGNFDLGIFDQGIWLLSRLQNPYLTTRGLHLFGDHATFIHILLAPIYWVWDDVKALLLVHILALAAGVFPLYEIAEKKLGSRWLPLVFCFSYLLFPALHYSILDQGYHPESFTVPLMLWSHLFLLRRSYRKYFLSVFLALICKEEIALTYFLYGLYVAYKYNRRIGLVTSASAVIYLLFVFTVVFPFFNGENVFYAQRTFGSFGETTEAKIKSLLNASFMWNKVATEKNVVYVRGLLEPVGYLIFLEPHAFACSASFWINLLTDWPYSHELKYHYTTPIIPVIYISLVEGFSRLRNHRKLLWFMLAVLFSSSLYGNYVYSPAESSIREIGRPVAEVSQFNSYPPTSVRIIDMMKKIPADASVSASYDFVPHLSHRKKIYMFPNPYRVSYFGHYVGNNSGAPDREVDFVLLDLGLLGEEVQRGTVGLIRESGNYTLVERYNQFELWRNTKYIYS